MPQITKFIPHSQLSITFFLSFSSPYHAILGLIRYTLFISCLKKFFLVRVWSGLIRLLSLIPSFLIFSLVKSFKYTRLLFHSAKLNNTKNTFFSMFDIEEMCLGRECRVWCISYKSGGFGDNIQHDCI